MESVSNVLFSLYRETPFHGEWVVACLQGAWPGILGEKIAGVCRPLALRGPELVVEVPDGAWMLALSSMKTELLDRIRRVAGDEVSALSFVRGGMPDSPV
jgi:predicted nucleic acid-binding Zn ribbon protein